ncbi:MAG: hypothetical protein AB2A00_04035 [Myxococcota bacterium]
MLHARLILVLGLAASSVAWAQEQPQQQAPCPCPMMGGDNTMSSMMQACMDHNRMTTQAIDEMTATMAQARKSGDAAKMRSALESAERTLRDMRQHTGACMRAMEQMPAPGSGAPR